MGYSTERIERFSVMSIDSSFNDETQANQMEILLRTVNDLVEQHNELAKFVVDNQENFESQVESIAESVIQGHADRANIRKRVT